MMGWLSRLLGLESRPPDHLPDEAEATSDIEAAGETGDVEDPDEYALDADGLNKWGRKWLAEALAKPWSERIWSIEQSDPHSAFGLILSQTSYDEWKDDPSVGVREMDSCRLMLARALAGAGRHEEALALFRIALAAREDGSVKLGEPPSRILLYMADSEARLGRGAAAVEMVRELLAIQTKRHFFYNDRARAYGRLAACLTEAGAEAEAETARAMMRAWDQLASASAYVMRDAPEGGLEHARQAHEMMIAAVGPAHDDLRFARRVIGEAQGQLSQ